MARTRGITARIPAELENRARAADPRLAEVELSTLLRVSLAVLAGDSVPAALQTARASIHRTGAKPKSRAA